MLTKTNFALGALAGERDEKSGFAFDAIRVTPEYTEATDNYSVTRVSCPNAESRSFVPFQIPADKALEVSKWLKRTTAYVGHAPLGTEVFITAEPESGDVQSFPLTKVNATYPDRDKAIPSQPALLYLQMNLWGLKRVVDFIAAAGGESLIMSFWDANKPLKLFSFVPNDQTITSYLMPTAPGHRSLVGDRLEDLEQATEDLERVIQRLEQRIDDLQYDKLQLEQELQRKDDLINELIREPRKSVLVEDAAA